MGTEQTLQLAAVDHVQNQCGMLEEGCHLFMMNNLVKVGFELLRQQDCFKAAGGDAPPVKVFHPEGTP